MATTKPSPRMTTPEIWEYVTNAHTGILTTLRRDGVPVALPLWFACLDGRIYLQTRGKKLQRLAHDPRASFLVESGERWADLKAVHLTGSAEIDRKYAAFRSAAAMPKETSNYYATVRTGVVRFTPDDRILNWDNTRLSA